MYFSQLAAKANAGEQARYLHELAAKSNAGELAWYLEELAVKSSAGELARYLMESAAGIMWELAGDQDVGAGWGLRRSNWRPPGDQRKVEHIRRGEG